ncbi:MAG: hypothetical protein Q4D54_03565, partial [Eubacteriales bacterium]|nr:hypothetical protein [Eubacteriales bacterium]
MDKSFMATIYIIAIAVFFLVLVIMTIMMIIGKIKHRDDDLFDEGEDEDEDDPDDMSEFYDKYEPVNDSVASAVQYAENVSGDTDSTVHNDWEENEENSETIGTIPEIPISVTDDTYVNTYDAEQDSAF